MTHFWRGTGYEVRVLVNGGLRIDDGGLEAAQNLTIFLARLCGIAAGATMVAQGQITAGTFVAFLSYMGGLFAPGGYYASLVHRQIDGPLAA